MRFRPVTLDLLVEELAGVLAGRPAAAWTRVAVDGAPPTHPGAFADRLADGLRLRGRPVLRVSARDYLRPASLRFERGRDDPDARYDDWLDAGALTREVLDPLGPGGTGRVLPSLWNAATDRATRADYVDSAARRRARGRRRAAARPRARRSSTPCTSGSPRPRWPGGSPTRGRCPRSSATTRRFGRCTSPTRGVRVDDPAHPALLDDSPV